MDEQDGHNWLKEVEQERCTRIKEPDVVMP